MVVESHSVISRARLTFALLVLIRSHHILSESLAQATLAPTAIFKDFQGLEFLTFKDFQGACEPCGGSAERMTLNLSRHNFFSKKTGS